MNPDLKDLRVAVVPTETGNGIDQSSSYEDIVACEETLYFSVPDYFKAQNDEELPALHWSFLLDYNKKEDITGMNTDGIDYDSKAQKIEQIKTIIQRWGETSSSELMLDSSPCIETVGNTPNVSMLVETYRERTCEVVTYVHDGEVDSNTVSYDELPEDVLDEIVAIMEDYDADMDKTEKRCRG